MTAGARIRLLSMNRISLLIATLLVLVTTAFANEKPGPSTQHATVVYEAIVYLAADSSSGRVATVTPGHEVALLEHNGPWVRAFANIDGQEAAGDEPEFGTPENVTPVSGWMLDKGVSARK